KTVRKQSSIERGEDRECRNSIRRTGRRLNPSRNYQTLPRSRVGGVERNGDAHSGTFETLHAMLEPRREKEQPTGYRRERNAQARAHPRQFDSRGFVHRDSWTTRIAEENLPTFHRPREFDVIDRREETARV